MTPSVSASGSVWTQHMTTARFCNITVYTKHVDYFVYWSALPLRGLQSVSCFLPLRLSFIMTHEDGSHTVLLFNIGFWDIKQGKQQSQNFVFHQRFIGWKHFNCRFPLMTFENSYFFPHDFQLTVKRGSWKLAPENVLLEIIIKFEAYSFVLINQFSSEIKTQLWICSCKHKHK